MRNSFIGIALAVVLMAGLFAAARFHARPGIDPSAAQFSDPAKAVAELKPDFMGDKMIGAWTLSCGRQRELPRVPQTGNSEGTPSKDGPPPGWKLPHCHTFQAVKAPQNPTDGVRVTLRRVGFKNVLTIFLRFPPDEVESGDTSMLQIGGTKIPMPIGGCTARFCLSILSVRHANEPALLASKTMTLSYSSRLSGKPVMLKYAMLGFAQSVGAMRQMDK